MGQLGDDVVNPFLLRAARICLTLWLGCLSLTAWADGKITHLSGPVSVQKLDGKTVIGMVGVKIVSGETITTGQGAFVRVEMTDSSEVVLRPDSVLKLEGYQFNPAKPADDKLVMNAVKGGLRTVTGLIGKRGNQNAYELKTPTATIGIRGTQFDARICAPGTCGALLPGTYVAVKFGAVVASNPQGQIPIPAGKVGFVPVSQPPVMLPRDPGIGFSPPPSIPKLDEKKKVQEEQAKANTGGSSGDAKSANTQGASAGGETQQGGEATEKSDKGQNNDKGSGSEKGAKAATGTDEGGDGSSSGNKSSGAKASGEAAKDAGKESDTSQGGGKASGNASNSSSGAGNSNSATGDNSSRSETSSGTGSASNTSNTNANTSSGGSSKTNTAANTAASSTTTSSPTNSTTPPAATTNVSQPAVSGGTCRIQ